MGTITIQLDDDAEATLSVLCDQTGLSISEVLKRGLQAYAALALKVPTAETPYEVFSRLDLGPGGYAIAPAKSAKKAATEAIRKNLVEQHGYQCPVICSPEELIGDEE